MGTPTGIYGGMGPPPGGFVACMVTLAHPTTHTSEATVAVQEEGEKEEEENQGEKEEDNEKEEGSEEEESDEEEVL